MYIKAKINIWLGKVFNQTFLSLVSLITMMSWKVSAQILGLEMTQFSGFFRCEEWYEIMSKHYDTYSSFQVDMKRASLKTFHSLTQARPLEQKSFLFSPFELEFKYWFS